MPGWDRSHSQMSTSPRLTPAASFSALSALFSNDARFSLLLHVHYYPLFPPRHSPDLRTCALTTSLGMTTCAIEADTYDAVVISLSTSLWPASQNAPRCSIALPCADQTEHQAVSLGCPLLLFFSRPLLSCQLLFSTLARLHPILFLLFLIFFFAVVPFLQQPLSLSRLCTLTYST